MKISLNLFMKAYRGEAERIVIEKPTQKNSFRRTHSSTRTEDLPQTQIHPSVKLSNRFAVLQTEEAHTPANAPAIDHFKNQTKRIFPGKARTQWAQLRNCTDFKISVLTNSKYTGGHVRPRVVDSKGAANSAYHMQQAHPSHGVDARLLSCLPKRLSSEIQKSPLPQVTMGEERRNW